MYTQSVQIISIILLIMSFYCQNYFLLSNVLQRDAGPCWLNFFLQLYHIYKSLLSVCRDGGMTAAEMPSVWDQIRCVWEHTCIYIFPDASVSFLTSRLIYGILQFNRKLRLLVIKRSPKYSLSPMRENCLSQSVKLSDTFLLNWLNDVINCILSSWVENGLESLRDPICFCASARVTDSVIGRWHMKLQGRILFLMSWQGHALICELINSLLLTHFGVTNRDDFGFLYGFYRNASNDYEHHA